MNNVRKRKNPDLLLLTRCRHLMEQGEEPLARFIIEQPLPRPLPKGEGSK